MAAYNHSKIEKKWQKKWAEEGVYRTEDSVSGKENYYTLVEYPYPSGNLHVGHWYAFAVPDMFARHKRMTGHNVLFPIGFDSFGLPAENAAIKNGVDPRDWTYKNIETMTTQLESMGAMFDWSRKVVASDPEYYKWTQWLFLKLHKHGLAFQKEAEVNWDPVDQTVLANEQVLPDGTAERSGAKVEKKLLKQWFFKITDYADRLLEDLDELNWPEEIKQSQRSWIGKNEGAEIDFSIFRDIKDLSSTKEFSSDKRQSIFKNLFSEFAKIAKNNDKLLVVSGGWNIDALIGHQTRNHDDIDICVLHEDAAWWKEQIEKRGFEQIPLPDDSKKDPRYHLNFVATIEGKKIKVDVIAIGFDENNKLYDMEWGRPDSWGFSRESILEAELEGVKLNTFSRQVQLWLKHADREKDDLDRKGLGLVDNISVFTTRPDTLFGATYMVLAPEHKITTNLRRTITNWDEVSQYIETAKRKTEIERTAEGKEKTGVELKGIKAINPATKEEVPIFVADYVLAHYGTGAIMAVPAHDERDFQFAKKYNLKIREVVSPHQTDEIQAVGALIQNKKGEFLFQRKTEDAPTSAGKIATFGGVREGDESAFETLCRELLEELELDIVTNAQEVRYVHFAESRSNSGKKVLLYYVAGVDDTNLVIHEGERIEKFGSLSELSEEEVSHLLNGLDIGKVNQIYTGEGILLNSGKFDGLTSEEAKREITEAVGGKMTTTYKLRDWLISRQRYWGCPIPIVYDPEGKAHPVPEEHLPWTLPDDVDFKPTGEAPLARSKELKERVEEIFGEGWTPEIDTMDTFVDSSWYFLRYTDPDNDKAFAGEEKLKQWMPVQRYSGGAEHTTMHLLYSRFFHKALYDLGLVMEKEPYLERFNRGLILGPDGQKMSKRWGNIVDPDEQVQNVGADAVRMYLAFIGPYNVAGSYPWNMGGLVGMRRFLERVWKQAANVDEEDNPTVDTILHQTIRKVGDDIDAFKFNTAISQMMVFLNTVEEAGGIGKNQWEAFLRVLAPFAPHMADELWEQLGHGESIHTAQWPVYDEEKARETQVTIAVQVNGKVRDNFDGPVDMDEEELKKQALATAGAQKWMEGKEPQRVIVIPNKLVNIVL